MKTLKKSRQIVSATPAEFYVWRKLAAAASADFLHQSRNVVRKIRRESGGRRFLQSVRARQIQTAVTAEFRIREQSYRTTRTRKTRLIGSFADDVERMIAALAAELYALCEAGAAIGAGNDARHHARRRTAAASASAVGRRLAA